MTRGRQERAVSSALRRSANMVLWYRAAVRDGLDRDEAAIVGRFLALNHHALETVDSRELGAMQWLVSGDIEPHLAGRMRRIAQMCSAHGTDTDDCPKEPPTAGPVTVRWRATIRREPRGAHPRGSQSSNDTKRERAKESC